MMMKSTYKLFSVLLVALFSSFVALAMNTESLVKGEKLPSLLFLDQTKKYAANGSTYSNAASDLQNLIFGLGRGDIPTVNVLMPKIELEQEDFYLALYYAFWNGKTEMIDYLNNQGLVDMKMLDEYRMTLLSRAISQSYIDLIERYFTDGSVDTLKEVLFIAIQKGNENIVRYLVSNYNKLLNCSDDSHARSPLLYAAHLGQARIAQILIDHGAIVNARDKNGVTALGLAVKKGHSDCVEVILNSKHTPSYLANLINTADYQGNVPLHWASFYGHDKIAAYLIKRGAQINYTDKKGITPLIRAVQNNKGNVVKILLSCGAKVNKSTSDGEGMHPIHWAAINGNIEITELLIGAGADINAQNSSKKRTPLHWVLRMGEWSSIHAENNIERDYKQKFRLSKERVLAFVTFFIGYTERNKLKLDTRITDSHGSTPFDVLKKFVPETDQEGDWYKKLSHLLKN